jgi:hypothetical protein
MKARFRQSSSANTVVCAASRRTRAVNQAQNGSLRGKLMPGNGWAGEKWNAMQCNGREVDGDRWMPATESVSYGVYSQGFHSRLPANQCRSRNKKALKPAIITWMELNERQRSHAFAESPAALQ